MMEATFDGGRNTSLSRTMMGNRSISAGRGMRDASQRLPMLRLDSEDRKSPEKTLAKISLTMNYIE